ncbi:MAG: hypothetical protein ACJAZB_001471 [Psychrosphaera sp.]|jgi:hypothetical protein
MASFKSFLALLFSASIIGCSAIPANDEIKANHFRFVNFKSDTGALLEYVHLMCFRKKPTEWTEPKQFEAGEHSLWVKANISRLDFANSKTEAFVNFKVKLEANKTYTLKRKLEGQKILMWIVDVETGQAVSEVLEGELKKEPIYLGNKRIKTCRSGTI